MGFFIGLLLGLVIGFTLGCVYWSNMCKKRNLFSKYGHLKYWGESYD